MSLPEDQLNKYVEWTRDGRSFSDIREELKSQGHSEDQIKNYIIEIDNAAIERAADGGRGINRVNFVTVGIIVIVAGVIFFAVGLYVGRLYIGIIVTLSAGVAFIFAGLRLKRRSNLTMQKPGRRRFNLKR